MRSRLVILMFGLVTSVSGCRSAQVRTPPSAPPAVTDPTAQGGRRVMLDAMQQMAAEDASAARR